MSVWLSMTPEGVRARALVARAKRRGELVPQPCEVCGDPKVDGHHDDYNKPLKVRWLCRMHHMWLHRYGSERPEAPEPQVPAWSRLGAELEDTREDARLRREKTKARGAAA